MLRELLKRFLPDRTCKDCDGRGQWQSETTGADGLTTVETKFCETCHGRGFITKDDDTDDFDLGGVGVTEFDDDEEE